MRLLLLSVFAVGLALTGQAGTAVIGTIADPSNRPVPAVRVLLQSASSELETTTDVTGQFRFRDVAPGDYEVRATVAGFDPLVRKMRIGVRNPPPLTIRLVLAGRKDR